MVTIRYGASHATYCQSVYFQTDTTREFLYLCRYDGREDFSGTQNLDISFILRDSRLAAPAGTKRKWSAPRVSTHRPERVGNPL